MEMDGHGTSDSDRSGLEGEGASSSESVRGGFCQQSGRTPGPWIV